MKNENPRLQVLLISVVLLGIYYIWSAEWASIAALVAGLAGIFSIKFCRLVEKAMQYLVRISGYIIQYVVLSAVFFLILTPVALLYRFFNKDPLRLMNRHESTFTERNVQVLKENLENPW